MEIILTEFQANLLLGGVLLLIILLALFFRFFSIYRYSKDLDVYLCIKRNLYKGKSRLHIYRILIDYYGFDPRGARELLDRANNDDIAWFQNLGL